MACKRRTANRVGADPDGGGPPLKRGAAGGTSTRRSSPAAALDSSCGLSASLQSDGRSGCTAEEDVAVAARALTKVIAMSPEALRSFVRRVTPSIVVRCIDWDRIPSSGPPKMSEGRVTWSRDDQLCFLQCCMEEIAAGNITSNYPKNMAYINLEKKLVDRRGKKVSRKQIKNYWDTLKKRWVLWCWLESNATGLGRDPATQAIVADDAWWEKVISMKKDVAVFRKTPLRFIEEHTIVFRGRTVTGDHSKVAGAAPEQPAQEEEAEEAACPDPIDLEAVPNIPFRGTSLEGRSNQKKGKGKRSIPEDASTGGSSKRTRTTTDSSAGAALQRLVDLRMESMESRAQRLEKMKEKCPEACMELVESDGHSNTSPTWSKAMHLFHDPYYRGFFLKNCKSAKERAHFIETHYNLKMGGNIGATAPMGGQPGFGGAFFGAVHGHGGFGPAAGQWGYGPFLGGFGPSGYYPGCGGPGYGGFAAGDARARHGGFARGVGGAGQGGFGPSAAGHGQSGFGPFVRAPGQWSYPPDGFGIGGVGPWDFHKGADGGGSSSGGEDEGGPN